MTDLKEEMDRRREKRVFKSKENAQNSDDEDGQYMDEGDGLIDEDDDAEPSIQSEGQDDSSVQFDDIVEPQYLFQSDDRLS